MFLAIMKLFLVTLAGFFLYRENILKGNILKFLTSFVINVSIPSLIFSNIITNFNPDKMPSPLVFILLSVGIFLLGLILGVLFSFSTDKTIRRESIALISFQNCGYLPMNIAAFLFLSPARETFLTYIFLYTLGFNILMWSIAAFLIFRKKGEEFNSNSIFTPPVVSVIISLLVVYLRVESAIPLVIISSLEIIGKTSFFLSMVILGAWLAKVSLKFHSLNVLKMAVVKLIVLPAVVFLIIIHNNIYSLLGMFVILEASMPSAASLPIVADMRGADTEFISYGVFITHIISVITIPLWVELFLKISKLNIIK